MSLRISQTAHYVPSKVITNDDLAQIMTTSDEWISSRTGIKQRHVVQNEQTSDLALTVAQLLLQKANLKPEQLDFIIVATMSPDYLTRISYRSRSLVQIDRLARALNGCSLWGW